MALLTFMSDFGTDDHYVAAVKGKILSSNVSQQVIDISHAIKPYDISHAAFVLRSAFKEFPQGSVHLVAIDAVKERVEGVALLLEGHFFVGFDSGLFSMISAKKPDEIVKIPLGSSTFPARDVLVDVAIKLANGEPISKLGTPIDQMNELFARQLKVTKREIVGNVMNIDRYGNLITNISKTEFDKMMELNGNGTRFSIRFGREHFEEVHEFYTDVDSGDCYVFFNSITLLQIGINKGNASQLLGLGIDTPVHIEFII